jgi:hypothetical protein
VSDKPERVTAFELAKDADEQAGVASDWRFTRLESDKEMLLARGYRLIRTWESVNG